MNSAHPFSQKKSFTSLWCWPKYNFITYTHCFEFYFFFRMGFQKHCNNTQVWMPLRVCAVPNSTKKSNGHFLGNWAASPNSPYWSQTLCNIMAAYPDSSCISAGACTSSTACQILTLLSSSASVREKPVKKEKEATAPGCQHCSHPKSPCQQPIFSLTICLFHLPNTEKPLGQVSLLTHLCLCPVLWGELHG